MQNSARNASQPINFHSSCSMSDEQKESFWEKICNLPSQDRINEEKQLKGSIKYPEFLFRYRDLSAYNLDAILTNRQYLSLASNFDDPFDSFMQIKRDTIVSIFEEEFSTNESKELLAKEYIDFLHKQGQHDKADELQNQYRLELANSIVNLMFDNVCKNILQVRHKMQENVFVLCLSEHGLNATMWLKYAAKHEGFVLIFDPHDKTNYPEICTEDSEDNLEELYRKGYPSAIYPIYYTDTPFDATNSAILSYLQINSLPIEYPKPVLDCFKKIPWDMERISLTKQKCHHHDEEWRILLPNQNINHPFLTWRPYGIILGLRMSNPNKHLVQSLAQCAGIPQIYQAYIDDNNALNAKLTAFKDVHGKYVSLLNDDA